MPLIIRLKPHDEFEVGGVRMRNGDRRSEIQVLTAKTSVLRPSRLREREASAQHTEGKGADNG